MVLVYWDISDNFSAKHLGLGKNTATSILRTMEVQIRIKHTCTHSRMPLTHPYIVKMQNKKENTAQASAQRRKHNKVATAISLC